MEVCLKLCWAREVLQRAALSCVMQKFDMKSLQILVDAGISREIFNIQFDSISFSEVVREANTRGQTPLFVACAAGHLAAAQWLDDAGAAEDAQTPDFDGSTPMSAACKHGHVEVVPWLFDAGAAGDVRTAGPSWLHPDVLCV